MTRHLNGAALTATGQAYTGQGILARAILYAAVPNDLEVALYDAADEGTTDPLTYLGVDPLSVAGEDHVTQSFEIGREFENGISAVLTGTGTLYLVFE